MDTALQLLASTILLVIATLIHGTGVIATSRLFRFEDRELQGMKLVFREFCLMVPMALCLFALHALEIFVYALFYFAVGDTGSMADALYVSAAAYTTLGIADGALAEWRLVAVFEGLAGFLLIGWSAAVFVADMERILRRKYL